MSYRELCAQLKGGRRRKVLALSYGWQSPDHPDPAGKALQAVRGYLRRQKNVDELALFWDFASCHQKPRCRREDGTDEKKAFGEALRVMGSLYASVTATAVLVLKDFLLGSAINELLIW